MLSKAALSSGSFRSQSSRSPSGQADVRQVHVALVRAGVVPLLGQLVWPDAPRNRDLRSTGDPVQAVATQDHLPRGLATLKADTVLAIDVRCGHRGLSPHIVRVSGVQLQLRDKVSPVVHGDILEDTRPARDDQHATERDFVWPWRWLHGNVCHALDREDLIVAGIRDGYLSDTDGCSSERGERQNSHGDDQDNNGQQSNSL